MDAPEHYTPFFGPILHYGTMDSAPEHSAPGYGIRAQETPTGVQHHSAYNVDSSCDYQDPLDEKYPSHPEPDDTVIHDDRSRFARFKESVYHDFFALNKRGAQNAARDVEQGLATAPAGSALASGRDAEGYQEPQKQRGTPVAFLVAWAIVWALIVYFLGDPWAFQRPPESGWGMG
ncbi:hypothetical protein K490DRAFT_57096 [Saccharata proteae CBS 121410]|uniref:Uncharacterized protein n=1 Tax=Saccharata proteae CBS 121410 TaxID=1314787 RepID=A0A9P4M031_9PEZI|nr:hypothetical protein K490DRAFT_57096 [Saccharata proteae CBS 121410]